MTNEGIEECIRDLRERVLETAAECLRLSDERRYRGLSEVAVRLTALIPPTNDVSQPNTANQLSASSAVNTDDRGRSDLEYAGQHVSTSPTLRIFTRRRGVIHEAVLDLSRISGGGRGECVLYGDQWMTTSRAAGKITGTAVNGWQNFWRYERSDGSTGPIQELRDQQLRSEGDVPW